MRILALRCNVLVWSHARRACVQANKQSDKHTIEYDCTSNNQRTMSTDMHACIRCTYTCLSTPLPPTPSIHQHACIHTHAHILLPVCLSVCLSVCVCVGRSVCLFVCLPTRICACICISIGIWPAYGWLSKLGSLFGVLIIIRHLVFRVPKKEP